MIYVVVLGIVLALVGFAVYISRKFGALETKRATLEESKMAQDDKIKLLEDAYLRNEAATRKQEKETENEDDFPEDGTVRFYPGRLRKNPDETN